MPPPNTCILHGHARRVAYIIISRKNIAEECMAYLPLVDRKCIYLPRCFLKFCCTYICLEIYSIKQWCRMGREYAYKCRRYRQTLPIVIHHSCCTDIFVVVSLIIKEFPLSVFQRTVNLM